MTLDLLRLYAFVEAMIALAMFLVLALEVILAAACFGILIMIVAYCVFFLLADHTGILAQTDTNQMIVLFAICIGYQVPVTILLENFCK